MKVWIAALWQAPAWPRLILFAALVAFNLGRWADRSGARAQLDELAAFVPPYLDIDNALLRLALALLVVWIALEIVFTVSARLRIRRDNQARPKR